MDDVAELALEGANPIINNYDKVTDPALAKIKALRQKRNAKKDRGESTRKEDQEIDDVKSDTGRNRGRGYAAGAGAAYEGANGYGSDRGYGRSYRDKSRGYQSSASDDEDYDSRPRRRNSRRNRSRHRRYVEESYSRRVTGGRAKSVGRDEYFGGRGLPQRRYHDSGSSRSHSRSHSRSRRKSLGQQALGALGIGGLAAAAKKNLGIGSRSGSRSRSRSRPRGHRRRRRRGSSYSSSPSPRPNGRAATFSDNRGYNDYDRGYRQGKYVPAGYIGNGDGADSGNPYAGALTRRQNGATSTQDLSTRTSSYGNGGGGGSTVSKSKKGGDSSSESDVCSSSEDQRRLRKTRGKEFLSAGLAAVATIHAAQGVYKSMEARDQRHEALYKNEITPEESKKMRNKARLQDAAAIAVAALGIKGAYSEWQEVQEQRGEVAKDKREAQERHEKRLRRAEKQRRKEREQRRDARGGGRRDRDDGYRTS